MKEYTVRVEDPVDDITGFILLADDVTDAITKFKALYPDKQLTSVIKTHKTRTTVRSY